MLKLVISTLLLCMQVTLSVFLRVRAVVLLLCLYAGVAVHAAGPSGGVVSSGAATITQSAAQTTIKQSSDKAVINWGNFSVGSGSSVRFVQPSASSIALNRVTGTQASVIQGALQANGQVWVLNPNGVLIAPGGQVAAGSFLATTRSLTDQQFMAGNYAFTDGGVPGASVVNQGSIIVADGGYAVLAGEAVRNEGYIEANLGQVVLGGAKAFTLDLSGDNTLAFVVTAPVDVSPTDGKAIVDNAGSIQAAGGRVLMTARAASQVVGQVINTGGVVAATSAQMVNGKIVLDGGSGSVSVAGDLNASGKGAGQTGGAIDVNAQKIQIKATAKLDVTGDAGGGKIAIGGGGPNTRTQTFTPAESTSIAAGARLDASALTRGDGGEIVVFTSLTNPLAFTQVAGSLIARGGAQGGNGGFVETSGYRLDVGGIIVDTLATKGRAGLWLLDPDDLVIGDAAPTCSTGKDPTCAFVLVGTINTNLATTDVEQTAERDITITAGAVGALPIAWNSGRTFTLRTSGGSISIGRQLTYTGVGGGLVIRAGTGVEVSTGAAISLGTGTATITGNTATGANSEIKIESGLIGGDITINGGGGLVRLNSPVTASGILIIQAAAMAINATVSATNAITLQGAEGTIADSLNIGGTGSLSGSMITIRATSVTLGGSITTTGDMVSIRDASTVEINSSMTSHDQIEVIASTSISLGANLSAGGAINLSAPLISLTNAVSTNFRTSLEAPTISFGGIGSFSTTGDLTIGPSGDPAGTGATLTASAPLTLTGANIFLAGPLSWNAFALTLNTPVFAPMRLVSLKGAVSGTGGARLSIPSSQLEAGDPGFVVSSITLNGTTPSNTAVFTYQGVVQEGPAIPPIGGVTVTVTNTAGGGGGGGGSSDTPTVVVAPVVPTTSTAAAAAAVAAKAAADAAAAKAIADAAAKASASDAATRVVVDQALTQAVATVVASTSAAVFVAPPPPPPATTTTSGASTTSSTDTTATSSSASTTTTTTAATTTTSTTATATTATTAATTSTAQGATVTQEFAEPLSVTTLSSTTSASSDPGDASAATTSTASGPASQTATPASTAAAAPAAPSLTPVAISKDGADAGDFTLQTVKPPAPVTTAKQEARPTERVTTTPVSPGIALQATQKTPAPSGSVLGREISGSGNSSNW
ncbi:FhaB Large exoproteins involved in heme utilization or adhesion [Burkholderiaceae bacterium]